MNKIENLNTDETHVCTSEKNGDWIIFSCGDCGYIRKRNWKTKEVVVVEGADPFVMHSGFYQLPGLRLENANFN